MTPAPLPHWPAGTVAVLVTAEGVVAVELLVDELRDHGNRRFEIDEGVRWHRTDAEAAARDGGVREALARLAG